MLYGIKQRFLRLRHTIARIRDEDWYATEFLGRRDFYRRAFRTISFNQITGDYAEFGYGSKTFGYAHEISSELHLKCKLWAFDSFEGLPEASSPHDIIPGYARGARAVTIPEAQRYLRWKGLKQGADYELVPGFYHQSLFEPGLPDEICLAYIDCNLYSSVSAVLTFLKPRLKNGMILAFDDYFCFSPTETSCERRAANEFFAEGSWNLVPYMQFAVYGMAFFVERREQ
jgi:O-methyltransferase